MRLFSYVVARDYGFAPNPFGGVCTLATCKPKIRQSAAVGDWVAGLASSKDSAVPRLVYVMRVDEIHAYDAYWIDPRFQHKKPSRTGSVKQLFGDNIYHHGVDGKWKQSDSHHSLDDGGSNPRNVANDTQSEGVLISWRYAYWGSNAIEIPVQFLDGNGESIKLQRGYRCHFSDAFVASFVQWFEALQVQGFLGPPYQWQKTGSKWSRPQ